MYMLAQMSNSALTNTQQSGQVRQWHISWCLQVANHFWRTRGPALLARDLVITICGLPKLMKVGGGLGGIILCRICPLKDCQSGWRKIVLLQTLSCGMYLAPHTSLGQKTFRYALLWVQAAQHDGDCIDGTCWLQHCLSEVVLHNFAEQGSIAALSAM